MQMYDFCMVYYLYVKTYKYYIVILLLCYFLKALEILLCLNIKYHIILSSLGSRTRRTDMVSDATNWNNEEVSDNSCLHRANCCSEIVFSLQYKIRGSAESVEIFAFIYFVIFNLYINLLPNQR